MACTSKKVKSRIALTAAAFFLIAAALLCAYVFYCMRAAQTPPSPDAPAQEDPAQEESATGDSDGFPEVDWAYWQGINPDVIGWLTIPGTDVNTPILQAHPDSPDYYLHHDVYGNYNPVGAVYLDADCEEFGLSSRNAVILGHHVMGNTAVGELDRLFIKIYEDNAKGKLNDDRFSMMSKTYEDEQAQLKVEIVNLQKEIEVQERQIEDLEQFIQRAHRYTDLTELTPYALRELVKAVYVEAPDKSSGKRKQRVHIEYDLVGYIPVYELIKAEQA